MHKHNFLRIVRFAADAETGGGADAAETSGDNGATAQAEPQAEVIEGYDALGEPGKRALDKMKAERDAAIVAAKEAQGDPAAAARIKAEREELAKTRLDLAAMQAKAEGKEAEFAAAQEEQRVKDEALAVANRRILRSEIKGAAKGVLNDPADAFEFIDLDQFEVDDNGDVDEDAIKAALDGLVKKKPYLAVQDGTRFEGTADGGARNESQKSIDEQIAEATAAGNFQLAIALKQRRAAERTNKS